MWRCGLGLLTLYRRACKHSDDTIDELAFDTPGTVPHWPAERRTTTLGVLLIRMVDETARHAGHADICRELIDGEGQADKDEMWDAEHWRDYVDRIQPAAQAFRN
ncbi:mycothiol transferase [Antrihabitans cavernicola]|uniref:DUF664 domain-containing protein n=1 Tax=Antrihabitans cavernicola TaxID=2495913 RepID=A0A5A7S642_9NOCA|nr:DUF664 domain-containing protein [Spelaeibacter cavernicola]KAA0021628.1 DUF664 domain-containing protein [Spelaeibacter cavernicola]